LLWAEQQTITVDKGFFSVLLGEGSAVASEPRPAIATLFGGASASDRYVGITVSGLGPTPVEITPRLQLLPAPYAYLAKNASALVSGSGQALVNVETGTLQVTAPVQITGPLTATSLTGNGAQLTQINAANITSGTIDGARVGNIDASKITSGTLSRPVWTSGDIFTQGNIAANQVIHAGSGMRITGSHVLEFGYGILSKEGNAGKIGYGTFSQGASLDIVGAGPPGANARSIRIFAENGTFMGDSDILLRGYNDHNHGIGWYGNGKLFDFNAWDGAVVKGYQNVVLGTTVTGQKWILQANVNGNCYARNVFVNGSDRNAKENFEPINARDILEKVAALPVTSWNYKESPGARHIGPVAQDFHAAFGLNGDDDKHISTLDESGVALAAIKGLHEIVQQQEAEIQTLKQDMQKLREMVDQLLKRQ
jgi:hypothetical protein